jgi:hypothetical protein
LPHESIVVRSAEDETVGPDTSRRGTCVRRQAFSGWNISGTPEEPSMAQHAAKKAETDPKTRKADPDETSNRIKDPKDWTTGGEPMTGAQASYLKTLSEETHEEKAFDPDLDKAEASRRIDALRKEAGKA